MEVTLLHTHPLGVHELVRGQVLHAPVLKHRPVRCQAESSEADHRQIFQVCASRVNVTYDDARLAMECCDRLAGDNRADCYASLGCDMDRVDTYLGPALRLEAQMQAPSTCKEEMELITPFGRKIINTEEMEVNTPFGRTTIRRPRLPAHLQNISVSMPTLPFSPPHLPDMPSMRHMTHIPHLLSDAASLASHQVGRFNQAVIDVHGELSESASFMFDEVDNPDAQDSSNS